jgi:hypothetical protein
MSDALTSLDRLLQSDGDLSFSKRLHRMATAVLPSYFQAFCIFRRDFLYGKCVTWHVGRHRSPDEFPPGNARMAIV